MQQVKNNIYGEVERFNQDKLNKLLQDNEVNHVEVFPANSQNMETAKKRVGKKFSA